MLRNELLLVRTALITIYGLLIIYTIKAAFSGDNLFWMPLILFPLLLFSLYQFRQNKYPILWKYILAKQQLNLGEKVVRGILGRSSVPKVNKSDLVAFIGNKNDIQCFKTSVFNIRTQSTKSIDEKHFLFPSIFYEDANVYDLINGDRIFHVGPEYTGFKTKKGGFDPVKFKQLAGDSSIKLIELDLSGSFDPYCNFIPAIGTSYVSSANKKTVLSTLGYTMFSDADGMVLFLEKLHILSGGKPVGIKLQIKSKKELYNICYAIKKVKFNPDFIIIESADQIGFCSPNQRSLNTMPLLEKVLFTSKILEVYELDKKIKIIAAANILSGIDLLKLLSVGANAVWSELSRYKIVNTSKEGINRYAIYEREDVAEFHNNIISSAVRFMQDNGLRSVNDITLSTFI